MKIILVTAAAKVLAKIDPSDTNPVAGEEIFNSERILDPLSEYKIPVACTLVALDLEL